MSSGPLDPRGLPAGYAFKPEYEITPRDADALIKSGKPVVVIDVRTQPEIETSVIRSAFVHIPLDQIETRADEIDAPEGAEVLTLCHHGIRSVKAALALRALGFPNARSIAGGIDLWTDAVDPTVPRYERAGGVCRRVP